MSLSHDLHQIGFRLSADQMNSMLFKIDLGIKGTDLHNNKSVCFERSMKYFVSRFTPSKIKVIDFLWDVHVLPLPLLPPSLDSVLHSPAAILKGGVPGAD